MIGRALAVWLLLLVIAVVSGMLREGLLTPRIGAAAAQTTLFGPWVLGRIRARRR